MADTVSYRPQHQAEFEAAFSRLHPLLQAFLGILGANPRALPGPMAMEAPQVGGGAPGAPIDALRALLAKLSQGEAPQPQVPAAGAMTAADVSRPWPGRPGNWDPAAYAEKPPIDLTASMAEPPLSIRGGAPVESPPSPANAFNRLSTPYSGGKSFPLGSKEYAEQAYSHSQPVRVSFRDGTVINDEVRGLNAGHALARAQNNWPDALIEAMPTAQPGVGP